MQIDKTRQAGTEIDVTKEMVDAGLDELRQHHFAGDVRYMVEEVYRAMFYAARLSASDKSDSK